MKDLANIYLNTLVPMVVEQTNRGERAYDIYSRLLKERYEFERACYFRNGDGPLLFQEGSKDLFSRVQRIAWEAAGGNEKDSCAFRVLPVSV